ncbi:MAG TPA: hypothetical protein VHB21_03530, partial [Minicystis sp.]|nr:hypothetical protein [Minicystis sp.]
EQDGYAPTRRAHDRRAVCDADLADLGTEAFAGVFQPCMALVSTRRAADVDADGSEPWPVERRDLDGAQRALLERLAALPPLPDHLFGERGLQTSRDDAAWMQAASDEAHTVALRVGADVEAFRRKAPSLYADPRHFGRRLRPTSDWGEVRLFIRQTARVPIAALADGVGFRNSILAGFDEPEHPAAFLVAWLNATPLRWLHFFRHRDARQGMPQVKIGHLRTIPRPPRRELVGSLAALGRALSDANCGADEAAQRDLDALAADALGLDGGERAIVARWREEAR